MRNTLILTLLAFVWLDGFAGDSTLAKYGNIIVKDISTSIESIRQNESRIIRLHYKEDFATEEGERVLGLYRRPDDSNIWDFSKFGIVNTYLERFKDSTDIDFYVVLASVYKYYDVNDDPNTIYEYQQLNTEKKERVKQVRELINTEDMRMMQDEDGNSKQFNAFAAKVKNTYGNLLLGTSGSRKVFVLLVVSSFYPNTAGGTVGKVLHSFAVLHDRFAYTSNYEFEEFMGMFLGGRWDFNVRIYEKEVALGQYIQLMYKIKQGQIIPETGSYKRLGFSIRKDKIKAGSWLDGFMSEVGKNYKPSQVPPGHPAPYVYDYTGAMEPQEINNALQKFQRIQTEKGYILKLFVTDHLTPGPQLNLIQNYVKTPGADDLILWVHFNKVKDPEYNFYYGSNLSSQKKELNILEKFIVDVFGGLEFDPFTAVLDGLAGMIGSLKIKARYYDPANVDEFGNPDYNPVPADIYRYATANQGIGSVSMALKILPGFPGMTGQFNPIRTEFALYCGAWNGVVDLLAGIPEFASFLIKIVSYKEVREEFVEGWNKLKERGILKSIKEAIVDAHTGNPCKVAAQIGHDIIDIISVVIAFAKVGTAAKIAAILDAVDVSSYVINFTVKKLITFSNIVIQGVDYSKEYVFKLANTFYRLHDIDGQPLLQVAAQRLNQLFNSINWSGYSQPVVLAGADGRSYTVLMSADELENVAHPGETVVEVIKKENGVPFSDAEGNGLVRTSSDRVVPARNILAASGHLANVIDDIKNRFSVLGTKLETIANTDPAFVSEFLSDFGDADAILAKFNKAVNEPDALDLDAWEVLYKAGRTELRKQESTLSKLTNLLKQNNFGLNGSAWGKVEFENMFKKHAQYGRVGRELEDEYGVMQVVERFTLSADELLSVLEKAAIDPKPGFDKVLDNLCCNNNGKRYIGAEWQLRYARDIWEQIDEFEYKFPPDATTDFRIIDIKLNTNTRIELKSWQQFLSIYEDAFIEEFAKDIRDIEKLEEMLWVFDKKGQFSFLSDKQGYDYLKEKVIDVLTRRKDDLENIAGASKFEVLLGANSYEEAIESLSIDIFFKKIFQIQ